MGMWTETNYWETAAQALFSSSGDQQAQLETLSNTALSTGIDLYQRKDYEAAAKAFKRAITILPGSSYSVDATTYLGSSYLKTDQPDKAIQAYKNGIELNPERDDLQISLAKLYYSLDRFADAMGAYQEAYRINPDANNAFSLGQAYQQNERYDDAEQMFLETIKQAPESGNGEYGLGQLYARQNRFDDALEALEKTVSLREDFVEGYLEMGYVYADMGNAEKAQEIYELLEEMDEDLADTLNRYMYKVEAPRLEFATADSTFEYRGGFRTQVAVMDSYLANANAEKRFSMVFQFGKEMDIASVQNRYNWKIERSELPGSERYNYGMKVPDTEVQVALIPDYVMYDSLTMQAKVTFTIRQNATSDATIDPAHMVFSFSGKDAEGKKMDPDHDQFSGYSGSF